ncbi:hypothetical protein B0O99DRAFT_693028 [Bisporella sp. PMI_857]|nr:hypothetical protein B0O99DRAFT_693028 [Bisporella sp. PMI_857]
MADSSGPDSVDQGEPNPVSKLEATEGSSSTPVAETNRTSDNEADLIPVGDGQVPASVVLHSLRFELTFDKDEELLQTNLLKLLQPPAFYNFALPATVAPMPPYNPTAIRARETWEELLGVAEERVLTAEPEIREAQEHGPAAYNKYEYSELEQDGYDSALNTVPMPRDMHFWTHEEKGNGERSLSFVPENFNAVESFEFGYRFNTLATIPTGLVFLVITNWQAWFLPHLKEAIPTFPSETLLHLSETSATTMLPLIDIEIGEMSCIMEHINVGTEGIEYSPRGFSIGLNKAHCLPLVVWTFKNGLPTHGYRPLVVVISASTGNISSKISSHYMQTHHERWDRLDDNQTWIYLDLYFLFTRWDRVWGAIKQNLSIRIEEVHGRRQAVSIIEQTRQLHRDNNVMISLREHLRIHKASLYVVLQRTDNWSDPGGPPEARVLHTRLDDAFQLLEYYDVTATSLLEQQQNLLSLAFNLETVVQGQAVARLNALAFVFLPLSLVASIFGITTFSAPPKWYPVAAIPVLIITVVIAWIANKFLESGSPQSSARQAPMPHNVEKSPTKVANSIKTLCRSSQWNRLRGNKIFAPLLPPSEAGLDAPTSINDPSWVPKPARSATLQSLEEAGFVPPRSTVQILPRVSTYNQTMNPDRHIRSQEMRVPSLALNHTIPSAQVQTVYTAPEARLPYPVDVTKAYALKQNPIPERLHNPTSIRGGKPSLVVPLGGESSSSNSPTQYIAHPIGGGDTVLLDLADGILIKPARDDGNAEPDIRVHLRTGVSPDIIATSIVQAPAVLPPMAQIAPIFRAPGFGRPAEDRTLESILETPEV